jgi:Fe-S cluster assembly scaffold protein SufB
LLKDHANVTHTIVEESGGMPVPGLEKADSDAARERESKRPALQNTVLENLDVHCAGTACSYTGTVLSMGGNGRVRIATTITLLKPTASCNLQGFSLAGGTCRSDMKTCIHHIADGCRSQQLQKNMVAGRATSSFRGRIRVERSAQQTDSQQLSRTVLLTDKCRAWAVPSLEIIADDVQCTHGATVSDLSEEELFYLRSRGLGVADARNLLMYAFCNDVIAHVPASVLGTLKSIDRAVATTTTTADGDDDASVTEGLQMRILKRLENLVPTGERAVKGEYQSI